MCPAPLEGRETNKRRVSRWKKQTGWVMFGEENKFKEIEREGKLSH